MIFSVSVWHNYCYFMPRFTLWRFEPATRQQRREQIFHLNKVWDLLCVNWKASLQI